MAARQGGVKQRRALTAVVLLAAAILILIIVTDMRLSRRLRELDRTGEAGSGEQLLLIVDQPQDSFWAQMLESARETAEPLGIAIDTFPLSYYERFTKVELMEMAALEEVDGILIQTLTDPEVDELSLRAREDGTAVIYLQNVEPNSMADSVIGVNDFEVAQQYAEILAGLPGAAGRVAIYPAESMVSNNLTRVLSETLTDAGWTVEILSRGDSGFDVADTVLHVLDRTEATLPDAFICLNENDTVNAVQATVDYNAVGRFALIGYYLTPEIEDALSKDLLQATISIDAEAMGRQAVESYHNLRTVGRTSELEIVDTRIILPPGRQTLPQPGPVRETEPLS